MSLDVYLIETGAHACTACGHVDRVGTGGEVYARNITHNLTAMADAAGLYEACWRPGQLKAPEIGVLIDAASAADNYHGPGGVYELEKTLPVVYARDLIPALETGFALLSSDPARFRAFDAPNGWGRWEHFVAFVADYLAACREHPDAIVTVSR